MTLEAPMARLRAHVRSLWPRAPILPALPFTGWALFSLLRGQVRWELILLGLFGLLTPYISPLTKTLYLGLMPAGFVAVLYDAMGFVKNVGITPERVHLCDLRALEIRWFGVSVNGQMGTVHDWLQPRATLAADVFFSIPYATFLEAIVAFAVFAYAVRDYDVMRRFTWCFFALSVMGFATYHLYPAAPPWYYHAHGCRADLSMPASTGPNLARVDAWTHIPYFASFYGRASDVFGAVPSLHVAYPLIIVLEGWKTFARGGGFKWPLRALAVLFCAWMCCAAVYLDHHWVIDVMVGLFYGVIAHVTVHVVSLVARRQPLVARRAAADSLQK